MDGVLGLPGKSGRGEHVRMGSAISRMLCGNLGNCSRIRHGHLETGMRGTPDGPQIFKRGVGKRDRATKKVNNLT